MQKPRVGLQGCLFFQHGSFTVYTLLKTIETTTYPLNNAGWKTIFLGAFSGDMFLFIVFFWGYNMILLYVYFGFGPVKRKFLFTCMKDYFYRLDLRLSQRDGGYNYITVLNVCYKDLQG